MRHRTTWSRDEVRTASAQRVSSTQRRADPYLMNQDHVNKNPPADKYENGSPSTWAEDVAAPNRWQSEYAGGTTKRNEIGAPEFRSETFNHPEKTASAEVGATPAITVETPPGVPQMDLNFALKKADLCASVARMMLPKTASENVVEDQALELMGLSDASVIDTYNRLASQQDGQDQDQQGQGQQQQQAGVGQPTAMQQCIEAFQQGNKDQFLAALQQMNGSQVQAPGSQWGQNNPVASKRTKTAQDQGQGQGQGQQQGQQQQAAPQVPTASQDQQAMQQQTQAMQQQIQALQQQIQQLMQGQQQGQQQGQGLGQQQQVETMVQASDDQLLAEMMAAPTGAVGEPTAELDIQLESSAMDMSEVTVTAEEQSRLNQLFSSSELLSTEQQQQEQGQGQGQVQAAFRSPSTRTVGTQPTGGVRKVGGVGAQVVKTAATEVNDLSKLWNTAPDVREAFGLPS